MHYARRKVCSPYTTQASKFNYDQSVQHLSHRLRQTFSGSFNAWAHLAGAGAQTLYPLMLRGNGGWDRREGG
jgi:hypothetical protein